MSDPNLSKPNYNLAMWAHLGGALLLILGFLNIGAANLSWLAFLPALIIRSLSTATDFDKRSATHALNFQLTLIALFIAGVVLILFTFGIGVLIVAPILLIANLAGIIMSIIASVAASKGQEYSYAFSLTFVK
jgi:uncharacterized Tic20 family protein